MATWRLGFVHPWSIITLAYIYTDISHYNILAKRHSIWKAGFVVLIQYRAKITLVH